MKNQRKKILLTGGGTAGHVIPHVAMLPSYQEKNWDIVYVGTNGIERTIIEKKLNLPFRLIFGGKLRRYFSWENVIDVFKIILGLIQSLLILQREKPSVVFSKGGFVSVPVCVAAWIRRIPVVSHESDLTPGLANRIIARFARKILCSFPPGGEWRHFDVSWVGSPIRQEILSGDRDRGKSFLGYHGNKPIVLVMGGSLGAKRLNDLVIGAISELTKDYFIVHVTGKGKAETIRAPDYVSFDYIDEPLKNVFAACDFAISRAGANAIFELLALRKPMLLIPLEIGSRGDQVQNANFFASKNWASVISERDLNQERLINGLSQLVTNQSAQIKAMDSFVPCHSHQLILQELEIFVDDR